MRDSHSVSDSHGVRKKYVYSTSLSGNVEDYNVVAVGKNRGAADNIFILRAEKKSKGEYFKWTLYKEEVGKNYFKEVAQTEDLSGGTLGGGKSKANDFVENADFMSRLRLEDKYDPINGYVSNNVRRNEIFQSMVTMVTCDWNNNGTDDLFVVAGGKVTVFDGNTLDKLAQFSINGIDDQTEVSVSAVAGDFRETGRKEVLVMCLAVDAKLKNKGSSYIGEHQRHGVNTIALVIPNSDKGGSQAPIYKNVNTSDVTGELFYNSHPTISIECFYPEGSMGKPMLAVAANVLQHFDNRKAKIWRTWYDHVLSLFDVDYRNTSWYSRQSQKTYTTILSDIEGSTFYRQKRRERPFCFGRPALKQAFMRGVDAPACLFWNSALYDYNKAEKKLSTSVSIDVPGSKERKDKDNAGFDHIIGGNIFTMTCPENPNDIVIGKESLVFAYSGSYCISDGTFHMDYDWKDAYYGLFRIVMNENNTGYYKQKGPRCSVTTNSPLNVATYATEPGMEIRLVSKDVTVTTPTIQYVLATPPYESQFSNKGRAKSYYSDSATEGSSESVTRSEGNSVSMSVGLADSKLSIIRCSVSNSMSQSWSKSRSVSTSTSQGMWYNPTEETDFVVFSYKPLDRFVYEIVDSRYPELNGKTIALTKSRGGRIAQMGMSVEKYNAMVKDAGGYVIGKNILSHTIGSVASYKGGNGMTMGTEEDVRRAFGLDDDDFLLMSGIHNVTESSIDATPSLSNTDSESSTSSLSKSTSVSTTFGTEWGLPISLSVTSSFDKSNGSSITTNWSKSVSLGGVVPGIKDLAAHNYSYRLVWYEYKEKDTSSDAYLQNFKVFNWYIVDNAMQESAERNPLMAGAEENVVGNVAAVVAGNKVITVTSAIGDVNVEIVNLQGVKVVEKIVNGTEHFDLPAGFYVVKAGNTVKKVMLQ